MVGWVRTEVAICLNSHAKASLLPRRVHDILTCMRETYSAPGLSRNDGADVLPTTHHSTEAISFTDDRILIDRFKRVAF